MDLKKLRKDAIVKFMDHIKDRQLKYGEKDAFRFHSFQNRKGFHSSNYPDTHRAQAASLKKKAKTGNATVAIVSNQTTDASDGNGSDENCDAIQRTSDISTNVQEKDKVAIRPRPTARSTSRQAAKAERMGTADKAMAEGSEIQRELERDVEVSTGIAKSSLREGKQKKEKTRIASFGPLVSVFILLFVVFLILNAIVNRFLNDRTQTTV